MDDRADPGDGVFVDSIGSVSQCLVPLVFARRSSRGQRYRRRRPMKVREAAVVAIAWAAAVGAEKFFLDGGTELAWWFQVPGFLAVFGFVICLALAFFAKALGQWLQRDECYY